MKPIEKMVSVFPLGLVSDFETRSSPTIQVPPSRGNGDHDRTLSTAADSMDGPRTGGVD
jgi:hypothetical protein